MVEVAEGTDELVARLTALGLHGQPRTAGRCRCRWSTTETYDQILGAVAELDLPLHSLDQRRHRVAELFAREAADA